VLNRLRVISIEVALLARRVETQLQCGVRKFRIFNRVFVLLYQSHVYAGSTEKKVWVIIYLTAGLNLISNVCGCKRRGHLAQMMRSGAL